MSAGDYRSLVDALLNGGWVLARINGSHQVYKHPSRPDLICVPRRGKRGMNPGLIKHLLCQMNNGTKFSRTMKKG